MAGRYALDKNKFLNDQEENRLVESLLTASERDRLLILLALKTGARRSELIQIRKQDLDPEENDVFIRGLKDSDDRAVPIRADLFRELHQYAMKQTGEFIFPIHTSTVRELWDKYRPNQKKFHALRHTYAMRLYMKTKDLKLVRDMLGHRNIANTMIYLDYVEKRERKKKAVL